MIMDKQMLDFVILGLLIGSVVSISIILKSRYDRNFFEITNNEIKRYTNKQIMLGMAILLPLGLYIIVNFPIEYLVYFELCVGVMVISMTAYILTKNKLAFLSGLIYLFLYYYCWNMFTLNLVALTMGCGAILMLSLYIKPKSLLVVAGIIVLWDFYAVYISQNMIEGAYRIVEVELPMYVAVQCTDSKGLILGLGDIVFTGLIVLKVIEWKKYSLKTGLMFTWTFVLISLVCLILAIQITPVAVPATLPIMLAGLFTIGIFHFIKEPEVRN